MAHLTEAEKKQRDFEVNIGIAEAKKINNLKVFLAVFQSNSKSQISKITEEEYNKMQTQKFIDSEHENSFIDSIRDKSLSNTDQYFNIDVQTTILDESNYPLAFYPAIWDALSMAEKIAVCKIVWKKTLGRDLKDFCNYDSDGVVMVGKNYQGALNVGSFYSEKVYPSHYLIEILNAENTLKFNYCFNELSKKPISTILDFNDFEEMQYLSPIEPITNDFDQMSDNQKAYVFDQIFNRKLRQAAQDGFYAIKDNSEIVKGLSEKYENFADRCLDDMYETDKLVDKCLGYFRKDRDIEYLKFKVAVFNNYFIKRSNDLVDKFNETKKELENAPDILSSMDLEEELKTIRQQINDERSNVITFEQAMEHFKDYFEPKPSKNKSTKIKMPKLTKEELEKLN